MQDADEALNSILTDIIRRQRNSREGLQEIARIENAAARAKRADIEAFLKAGG